MDTLTKLQSAIESKKLKTLKDTIKAIEQETEQSLTADDYAQLIPTASALGANPILKYILPLAQNEASTSKGFLEAIKNNKMKTAELLIEHGANIQASTDDGKNAILIATEIAKVKALEFFIDKDISFNQPDETGKTPLIEAVKNNKPKLMEVLLEKDININTQDKDQNTALHHAILHNKFKLIDMILEKKPDLNIENKDGLVPLALAWKEQATPKVLDALLDQNTTNMQGEAGKKIMKEAYTISKGAKKEQRKRMKKLFFDNPVSTMTEEEFIKKHGAITEIDTLLKTLETPNSGELIMKGVFTNIGYYPHDVDYQNMKHNWDALDAAIEFSNTLAQKLNDADCHAPNTEGSIPYEPFFIPYAGWIDLVNMDAKASAEAIEQSHGAYNTWITTYYPYGNVFFDDIEEHYEDEFIDEKQYKAFKEVSELMNKKLTNIKVYQLYTDFVDFPWIFVGLDAHRNMVGVITRAVWT